ncbi:hypothetical protein [Cohnella candidum]|uniref:Uncharacterized protein n=1 Tax=Cohnella candidum TaxID=2674991 RepID=A0A3G3K5B4_9BACL|nr:hypothetical protein [Cohnella candidum]AYQ74969.1 hypothetical protein EAV92_21875 [Cohnella candidum]
MSVVVFLLLAWFSVMVLVTLPSKLPLIVNVLLFMAIDIVLTNKLTIIGFNLQWFKIHTDSVLRFLSLILHNDVTVTFALLVFANVFLLTPHAGARWAVSLYAFLFQILSGLTLRWNGVLTDVSWNFMKESLMIALMMGYTLLVGSILQRMAAREGWIR